MFSKSADGDSTPATGTNSGGRSQMSADLHIEGNITSAGTIEVMGEVKGDIDARHLVIGAEGRVTGKVRAESVDVRGRLDGSASCQIFTLRSSAVASVQVTYETLVIESGARIEGKFQHASKA